MKKKIVLFLTIMMISMNLASCGKEEVGIPENVKAWCKKHEVNPKEFGVSWLQKQTWDKEKQESKLTIDYPVDIENAYQLFDEYYEWDAVNNFKRTIVPEQVINDEILIDGYGQASTLRSYESNNGKIYHNDIYSIGFSNFIQSSSEDDYITVRDSYDKGWYYFEVSPAAIGLSNDYQNKEDRETIEQMLDEIVDLYGAPDYVYTGKRFNTVADMFTYDEIGVDGEKYLDDKVVNALSYWLIYDYTDYILSISFHEERVGYDTQKGTIDKITSPGIYIYPREWWDAELEFSDGWWSLHTLD